VFGRGSLLFEDFNYSFINPHVLVNHGFGQIVDELGEELTR